MNRKKLNMIWAITSLIIIKNKMLESIVDVSSRQLGYPLQEDVCHEGVLDFVPCAIIFGRVTDTEVDMGVLY